MIDLSIAALGAAVASLLIPVGMALVLLISDIKDMI